MNENLRVKNKNYGDVSVFAFFWQRSTFKHKYEFYIDSLFILKSLFYSKNKTRTRAGLTS